MYRHMIMAFHKVIVENFLIDITCGDHHSPLRYAIMADAGKRAGFVINYNLPEAAVTTILPILAC